MELIPTLLGFLGGHGHGGPFGGSFVASSKYSAGGHGGGGDGGHGLGGGYGVSEGGNGGGFAEHYSDVLGASEHLGGGGGGGGGWEALQGASIGGGHEGGFGDLGGGYH